MTTNYHTPVTVGAAANAASVNSPLAELDEALTAALLAERDGHIIQGGGVDLAQQPRLDFVGDGVVVTNESGKTLVTINPNISAYEYDVTAAVSLAPEVSISDSLVALKWHYCVSTTADYVVVLPTAVGYAQKYLAFRIGISSTKLVTLDGYSSETIDGELIRTMWAGESCILYSDGANWYKVAGKTIPMMAIQRASVQQTGIVPSTITLITLGTSDVDNTGSMNSIANSRVYCRRSGVYKVKGILGYYFMVASANNIMTRIHKNSHATTSIATNLTSGALGLSVAGAVSIEALTILAGDWLSLHTFHTSSSNESTRYAGTDAACALSMTEIPTW